MPSTPLRILRRTRPTPLTAHTTRTPMPCQQLRQPDLLTPLQRFLYLPPLMLPYLLRTYIRRILALDRTAAASPEGGPLRGVAVKIEDEDEDGEAGGYRNEVERGEFVRER